MTVRDRYDAKSKAEQHAGDTRTLYVRWGTQRECERYTIAVALQAVRNGDASPFALDLVTTWQLEERSA
jgi:hypothetical protein